MRDPIDELSSFDPGGDMNPLPPSEIRRRGNRLRRRNQALVAAGAAAAVVLIATPLAVLGAQRADDGPDPAPSPTITGSPSPIESTPAPGSGDTIPDGFPLATGWPTPDADAEITSPNRRGDPVELTAGCDGVSAPDPQHADRMWASFSYPEDYRVRQLTTYVDAEAAVAAVQGIVQTFRDCPVGDVRDDGMESHNEVRRLEVGGESWAIEQMDHVEGTSTQVFGQTTVIVRVGSAVLIIDHGGHGGTPRPGSVPQILAEAAIPIARMCRFTLAGCAGGTTPPSSSSSAQLTDDDLLTAGQLPTAYGLTPYEELPAQPGATLACQAEWLTDMGAEELVSREFGAYGDATDDQTVPSGQVNTAVLRFADADAASAAYDTIKGWVESCDSRVDDRWTEAEPGGSAAGGAGPPGERSEWVSASFCEDPCTADWFARMGYAQIGDRVVVVQLQELGAPGSREPKIWGMDEVIDAILDAAAERARP